MGLVSCCSLKSSLHMVKGAETLIHINLYALTYTGAISSFLELKSQALVLCLKHGSSSVGCCNHLAGFTEDPTGLLRQLLCTLKIDPLLV
jgi:hypothetical protein